MRERITRKSAFLQNAFPLRISAVKHMIDKPRRTKTAKLIK